MKITGTITAKSKSFEELLQKISEKWSRCKLLKTIHTSECFTDGTMLTRLLEKEKQLVSKTHYDTLITDSDYKDAEPLDVREAIPKYLTKEFKTATLFKGKELKLWKLEGDGIHVFIEESVFSSFYNRISFLMGGNNIEGTTAWWYSKRNGPVVVVDAGSFSRGRLLGTVAPYSFDEVKEEPLEPKLKRVLKSNGWNYKKADSLLKS